MFFCFQIVMPYHLKRLRERPVDILTLLESNVSTYSFFFFPVIISLFQCLSTQINIILLIHMALELYQMWHEIQAFFFFNSQNQVVKLYYQLQQSILCFTSNSQHRFFILKLLTCSVLVKCMRENAVTTKNGKPHHNQAKRIKTLLLFLYLIVLSMFLSLKCHLKVNFYHVKMIYQKK
jgi:hypothetical protein